MVSSLDVYFDNRVVTLRPTYQLYRLRRWGDPVLVTEAGASVELVNTSNFQAIGLYNRYTEWGGVSNFLNISRADIDQLISMQVEDEYEDKVEDWRSQKMNWLCKERGTIYFTGDGVPDWRTASSIRWGTIGLGNNIVAVEGLEDMLVRTRGETKKRWRQMAKLAGFRKSDWNQLFDEKGEKAPNFDNALASLVSLGLVHRCYCAYAGNRLGDSPKGIVYSPFWSPLDWEFIGPAQPQPSAFYVPVTWLMPV